MLFIFLDTPIRGSSRFLFPKVNGVQGFEETSSKDLTILLAFIGVGVTLIFFLEKLGGLLSISSLRSAGVLKAVDIEGSLYAL